MKFSDKNLISMEKFIQRDLPKFCLAVCIIIAWGLGIHLLSSNIESGWWIGPLLLLTGLGAAKRLGEDNRK